MHIDSYIFALAYEESQMGEGLTLQPPPWPSSPEPVGIPIKLSFTIF